MASESPTIHCKNTAVLSLVCTETSVCSHRNTQQNTIPDTPEGLPHSARGTHIGQREDSTGKRLLCSYERKQAHCFLWQMRAESYINRTLRTLMSEANLCCSDSAIYTLRFAINSGQANSDPCQRLLPAVSMNAGSVPQPPCLVGVPIDRTVPSFFRATCIICTAKPFSFAGN